jgi:release factor glutamine methyltransferase
VTVLEVIQKSAGFLGKKGVDSPRLQAEWLLAHVLKTPRMKLYLDFERALSPAELDAVRELVKRRGQREPLQHILGTASFCGLELAVNRHVLVPRPETELLAEAGWQLLAPQPSTALDFGTGSGCIAIALAVQCPAARLVALEASAEALAVARQNAARHGVAERIQFVAGEGFDALPAGARFDLIISNPPYIPTAEIASLPPEVRDYDPHQALDGGPDGLACHRLIAARAGELLKPGGKLMLELGDGQADAVRRMFEAHLWVVEAVKEDYSRRPRILIASLKR